MIKNMHDHLGENPSRFLVKKAKKNGIDIGGMLCGVHCCWFVVLDKNWPESWYGCRCKMCEGRVG